MRQRLVSAHPFKSHSNASVTFSGVFHHQFILFLLHYYQKNSPPVLRQIASVTICHRQPDELCWVLLSCCSLGLIVVIGTRNYIKGTDRGGQTRLSQRCIPTCHDAASGGLVELELTGFACGWPLAYTDGRPTGHQRSSVGSEIMGNIGVPWSCLALLPDAFFFCQSWF